MIFLYILTMKDTFSYQMNFVVQESKVLPRRGSVCIVTVQSDLKTAAVQTCTETG